MNTLDGKDTESRNNRLILGDDMNPGIWGDTLKLSLQISLAVTSSDYFYYSPCIS